MSTLSIAPIVARVEAETTMFREVSGAAGYDRARREARRPPAAFVIPLRDRPAGNQFTCGVGQRVGSSFAVIILARDVAHGGGTRSLTEIEAAREQIHSALLGWSPESGFEAIIYTGGLLVSDIGKDGLMAWQASYESAHQLRALEVT